MLGAAGRITLAGAMMGAMALGGCATVDSVKQAQATADQALAQAQAGNAAAHQAQSSADAAMAAAQRAQATADAAGSAAQQASATATSANQRVDELSARVDRVQAGMRHKARHRRHHHRAAGERG